MLGSAMSSMEDDLIESGHPLLALLNHISNAPNSLLKSWATALSPSGKEAAALQAAVRRFILSTPSDSKVLASGVVLLALCKLPTWPLKVDAASLQRIEQGGLVDRQAFGAVASRLSDASIADDATEINTPAAEHVAELLAQAVLSGEGRCPAHDSAAKSELRQRGARDWVLLRAFCHQHGLEMDASRMVHLAADNDWVHFLAEASTQSYFYHEVVHAAVEYFQDGSLQHHVLHVLHGLAPNETPGPQLASGGPRSEDGGSGLDLLNLLAQAGRADDSSGILLAAARTHKWPMLALLAACNGCSQLRCMAEWLHATLAHSFPAEGNEESSQGDPRGDQAEPDKADGMENWRVAAGSALLAACRQGAFKQAIEAVQLFMPGCPLIGCLRFLQCGACSRYREMEAHLEALTHSMTPPPARRPGSAEGETEAAWVMGVTWAVADDLLRAAPSASERLAQLQRITSLDLPVPGGSGSARYGAVHLLYELVGREAEPFVSWSCPAPGAPAERLPVYTDAREALAHMLTQQKWQEARRWAAATGQAPQQVTLAQAGAMLADWRALAWSEGVREGVWRDIHALFAAEDLPPLLAAHFLVEQARGLAAEGAVTPREHFTLLQEAHEWLRGGCCAGEREEVLQRALARGLQLLSARLQLGGQPAPLHAGPLIAPWAAIASDQGEPDNDSSASMREGPKNGAGQAAMHRRAATEATTDTDWKESATEAALSALQDILGTPGPKEVTAAVRAQLEQGNVAGARALSRELASPPIEVVLVEAAVAIIRQCRPPGSAESGLPVSQVVPTAVMSFLRRRGQTAVGTAQEVLEALQVCAGRGAARPVCALAAASFRAATLLGMTCAEAARLGPRQSLQILLMKGPSAAPTAIEYATAYQMSVEETADVLADAYLKGLLAAHHDGRAESAAAWTPADFVSCTEGLGAPGSLGSALLAQLLERHGALPPEVEAGLLLAAHACYEAGGAADALDVLVKLAARAARSWAAAGEWRPLVHLVAGLGQYQAVRAGMDLLVRADHLELLLSKRAGSGASADIGVRLWRAAVLAAIQRQRPGDAQALSIAHHHFGCTREMAADLHARAQKRAESGLSGRPMRLQDSLAHLDAMASALAAACAFSDAECGFAAAEAVKTAVRLGQQVQSPPR